ncbi:MAG TPA: DUF4157 domain-containing protein [Allosphingosinicella sp.]|jgi:hypothetical protein
MAEHAEPARKSKPARAADAKAPAGRPAEKEGYGALLTARAEPGLAENRRLLGARPAAGPQPIQRASAAPAPNRTGLPDRLKAGVEALSGLSMDDVRVHRNSSEPAKLGALAYAKGSDIHLGAGQEQHLPHEAWHVVQQKQGRVKPTLRFRRVAVSEETVLERQADTMGSKAAHGTLAAMPVPERRRVVATAPVRDQVVQRYTTGTVNQDNVKVSANRHYITYANDKSVMYSLHQPPQQAAIPRSSAPTRPSITFEGLRYKAWEPQFQVIEDCVAAMEEIMIGQQIRPDIERTLSEFANSPQNSPLPFGRDPSSNVKYGAATREDAQANPEPGQGFVIVRQNMESGHPYHGAAVVAQDGPDHVTLETSAPPTGESSERVDAVYDMYGMTTGKSFFATYAVDRAPKDSDDDAAGKYGKDASVSVVNAKVRLPRHMGK